jgi:hypothetical protein
VPVWHDKTKDWVRDGKLVLLGVTQEQHPERCRLFARWKGFGWPILHDPINVLESVAVPIVVAIDEHGIVRSTRPRPETFAVEFLGKTFADDARGAEPPRYGPTHPPAFDGLRKLGESADTGGAWRALGDALALWGGPGRVNDAIAAYARAAKLDPKDGRSYFRLGVCLRRRYESELRQPADFQAAVENWGKALDLDPNQYVWRRRVQQYGPRLDKPYPFYDWVPDAEAAVRARGEKPVELPVRPGGAEIAQPAKAFPVGAAAKNPDLGGKINRDEDGLVKAEVVVVPATVKPGQSGRVHVTFRLDPLRKGHWNNEAEPLRVWVDPPEGWAVSERLVEATVPKRAVSDEDRAVGFEVKAPEGTKGTVRVPAYVLYHVCDADGGQCRLLRLDFPVEIVVGN